MYSTQYSTDTGITHIVAPNQTTDNLKIQMRYNSAVGKWMPAGELTPLKVLVQCNNHQGQRYTITFNGNGGTPSVTSMTTIDQKLPELPIATRSGIHASFLPKPLPDQAGSGLHINLSLYMDGRNLFEGDIAPDSIAGSFMASGATSK